MTNFSKGLRVCLFSLSTVLCSSLGGGTVQALAPEITSTGPIDTTPNTLYTYPVVATDPGNLAPVINNSTPSTQTTINTLYTYDPQATDGNNDPLTTELAWTLPAGVTGITFDGNGVLNWTPTRDQAGEYWLHIDIKDNFGGETNSQYQLTVTDPNNQLPVIGQTPITQTHYGQMYSYDLQATDGDGDPLTYKVWSYPVVQGLQISSTGVVTWTPVRDDVGETWVTVEVDDAHLGVTTQDYNLTVIDPNNQVPVIGQLPTTQINYNTPYSYDLQASDGDGDALTYNVQSWPTVTGLTLSSTGILTWTPTRDDVGEIWITVTIDDGYLGVASHNYLLTVIDPNNQEPVFSSSPITQGVVGALYQYTAIASDADGDTVSYALFSAPAGMTIDSATGQIQWTPTAVAPMPGEWVKITASDNYAGSIRQDYRIEVTASGTNTAPTITSTAITSAQENSAYTYDVDATDAEGNLLTYGLSIFPAGMNIDPQTGIIRWPSSALSAGEYTVTAHVRDSTNAVDTQSFVLTIEKSNSCQPPA